MPTIDTSTLTQEDLQELDRQGVDTTKLPPQIEVGDSTSSGDVSTLGAMGKTLQARAGSIIGSSGAIPGALAGTAVGGPIGSVIGALAGGFGGSYGGGKIQQAIQGPEVTQRLENELANAQQQHPFAVPATDITASMMAGGMKPSLSNLGKAGKGLIGLANGKAILNAADRAAISQGLRGAVSEAGDAALQNKEALGKVALGAGLNTAIGAGSDLAQGNPITGKSLLENAATGALFSEQNALGRRFLGHPNEPSQEPAYNQESSQYTIGKEWNPENGMVPPATIKEPPVTEFTAKNEKGEYVMPDQAIRDSFKNAIPKPDVTGWEPTAAYTAKRNWEASQRMPVDEMRSILDKQAQEKLVQMEQDVQVGLRAGESEPNPGYQKPTVPIDKDDAALRASMEQKLGENVGENKIDEPTKGILNPESPAAHPSPQLNIAPPKEITIPKPLNENSLRILNKENLIGSDVNRPENYKGLIAGTDLEKWADETLKGKLFSPTPDILAAAVVKGAAHIERGLHDFATWSAAMIKDMGETIKPHLQKIWNDSHEYLTKKVKENATGKGINKENNRTQYSGINEGERSSSNNQEGGQREGKETGNSNSTLSEQKKVIPDHIYGGKIQRAFASMVDRIRSLGHPLAKDVGDAFYKTLDTAQKLTGKWSNRIIENARKSGLTEEQGNRVEQALRAQRENDIRTKNGLDKSLINARMMLRSVAERSAYDTYRQVMKESGEHQIKIKEPVIDRGSARPLKQDPNHYATVLDPKVAEIYRNNTDKAAMAALDKKFMDYGTRILGEKPAKVLEDLNNLKAGIQGRASNTMVGNQENFNAVRKPQGNPLPPEFTRKGYLDNASSYFHRRAMDNAYYEHVESNHKVLGALGEAKDPWGKDVEQQPGNGIAGNEAVRAQLNQIKGHIGGAEYHAEQAASSLATTAFVGPATELHKFTTNQITTISGYLDSPREAAAYVHGMTHCLASGIEHATENGVLKPTARSINMLWKGTSSFTERMQAAAQIVRNISSLNGLVDRLGTGLMQGGLEQVIPIKVELANKGNVRNQMLMRRLDPDYQVGKQYSQKEIQGLTSSLISYIHGTGDGRTMPTWMSGDSELSGFFKLSHWSIAQTNRFFTDVYTPARMGDYSPLLKSVFGAAVGGYMIKELREELQGKKGQIPSLSELASSSKGLEGNKGLLFYNLAASAMYAGFGGILSQAVKIPIDAVYGNTSQGAVFPLDEVATDLVETIHHVTSAIANDPNVNWGDLATQVGGHLLTSNMQLARIGYNQAINNGLITGLPAEKKELSDRMGQLRRFNLAEGLPRNEIDVAGNPYMNLEQKQFKLEQDPQKAMQTLPSLVQSIVKNYGDHPDVMLQKLQSLKQNSYATFPSMEKEPLEFMRYITFLKKEKGDDKAQEALTDYLRHKIINEAKGEAVP